MITLSITVPNGGQIIASGFASLQVNKSSTGTSAGPYSALTPLLALDPTGAQTTYSFTDPNGGYGDWYAIAYVKADGVTVSSLGKPQPGYLSDLCQGVRDLLGVSTVEASDTTIQGPGYLGMSLALIRQRLATFDTLMSAGGDTASLCLGALTHLTAAKMCPRMTIMVVDSEQIKDYRYQRNRQMDWNATQTNLMATYEQLIALADAEDVNDALVYVSPMALAGETRAGYDTTGGLWPTGPDPVDNAPYADSLNVFANPSAPYTPNPAALI